MLTRLLTGGTGGGMRHVVVSLTDAGVFGAELRKAGVPLYCLGVARGRVSLSALWKLRGILREEAPDVVQTWLYHADLAGLLAVKIWGGSTRLIWNVRGSAVDRGARSVLTAAVVRLLALLSGVPDAIVVNSDRGRQDHQRMGYHPARWVTIPNGFDVEQFRPDPMAGRDVRRELNIPEDVVVFGMVARFHPMKNHAGFLEAASILADKHPTPHFLMAGDGVTSENPLLADAMQNPLLRGRIHCLGLRRDVPALMSAIDCLVLFSGFGEGFPNVLGEAMACEVPCIATDVGEAVKIVDDTGFIVRIGDPSHLSDAMEQFLKMPADRRGVLGKRARERIEKNFSIEKVRKVYQELYEDAVLRTRSTKCDRSELEPE